MEGFFFLIALLVMWVVFGDDTGTGGSGGCRVKPDSKIKSEDVMPPPGATPKRKRAGFRY